MKLGHIATITPVELENYKKELSYADLPSQRVDNPVKLEKVVLDQGIAPYDTQVAVLQNARYSELQ